MVVIKVIFIFFTVLYSLSKIVDSMNNRYTDNKGRILNLLEIIAGIILTLIIFKF